jgi:hypothetical protein
MKEEKVKNYKKSYNKRHKIVKSKESSKSRIGNSKATSDPLNYERTKVRDR